MSTLQFKYFSCFYKYFFVLFLILTIFARNNCLFKMEYTSKRLLSLDVMRGITIAGMILVNNPGAWKFVYAPLLHAKWDGITPTDVIFPFFLFIMGITTYISLRKYNFEPRKDTILKIIRRTVVIFLCGLALHWLILSFKTWHGLATEPITNDVRFFKAISNFGYLRISGVLQRLAITYCITALIAIFVKHKYIVYIITATLIGYFLLLLFGNGFEDSEQNIISIVDRALLGQNHLLPRAIDTGGPLATIATACNVLIGFLCAKIITDERDNSKRMLQLFIVGAILTFAGMLLSYGCPFNKTTWTPTYVLITCGLAATLLSLLIWLIDVKGHKQWSVFFESFGVNPLFIYVLASVMSTVLSGIRFTYGDKKTNIIDVFYSTVLQPVFGNHLGSLAYALLLVGFCWIVAHYLYKKKIYIKI